MRYRKNIKTLTWNGLIEQKLMYDSAFLFYLFIFFFCLAVTTVSPYNLFFPKC